MNTTAPDGTTLHYEIHGSVSSQPAVMLVHGITESSASWAPVTERLAHTHQVVAVDLRGHGESGTAATYDLASMASDVAAVAADAGIEQPHLVGHSLGGAVVSAAGAAMPVSSVVDVDQSLQLGAFQEQLGAVEAHLRDPAAFGSVIESLFASMAGQKLSTDERDRVNALRRPDQTVVLGVWDLILTSPIDEIEATVDGALAGYTGLDVPYLALFGIDPGDGYAGWLSGHIDGAVTELWADHGHYPHLVDPDRFVDRLLAFWS